MEGGVPMLQVSLLQMIFVGNISSTWSSIVLTVLVSTPAFSNCQTSRWTSDQEIFNLRIINLSAYISCYFFSVVWSKQTSFSIGGGVRVGMPELSSNCLLLLLKSSPNTEHIRSLFVNTFALGPEQVGSEDDVDVFWRHLVHIRILNWNGNNDITDYQ